MVHTTSAMKPSSVSLVGSRLCFDPSGGTVFAIEPDAIAIADLRAGKTHRLPYAHARAITALVDQLWIATSDESLVRTDFAGRTLGEPSALPFAATGLFVPAPCGPPAAAWSSTPAVVMFDDLGTLRSLDGSDADATFPLTARRHLTARGSRLTLPSGSTVALPPGSTAVGGVVMADGKHVTVLVAGASGRQLLSISIGTGQVVQRCAIGAGIVRVAARRGAVVAQTAVRTFELIDLRSGRVTATFELAHDVGDLAIDPDAQRCVLRGATGTIEVCELAELVRARTVVAQATESIASEPAPAPAPAPVSSNDVAGEWTEVMPHAATTREPPAVLAIVEEVAELVVPPLRALSPRAVRPVIDRSVALAHLERELRSVSLWLLAAIARGWDSRRIGYGNEGKHPFELEVAAILGLESGHATSYVETARDRLDAHELELAADPAWRGLDTPLGRLADELGLSSRALDILMVVAAPALRGELARLTGILANDPARGLDELAVQQILGARHDRDELAAELDANAPLVRLGLVQLAPHRRRPFAEVSIDPAIVDRLRGRPAQLGTATVRRASDRALAELDIPRAALTEALAALARPPHDVVRISIYGRTGCGRTTFLAAACTAAGRELAVIDALALPRAADAFVVELERALRRAQLVGLVPCIAHLDEVTFDDRAARDVASEVLRLHPGPVAAILGTGTPSPFAAGHISIVLPVLAETDRRRAWLRALGEANVVLDEVDALAARYRIGPGVIRRAIAAAHDAQEPDSGSLSATAVEAFIRQTRDARLGQFATRVERLASWSNIVLPPDILDSLRELVGRVRHGRLVYDTWGMSRTIHSSRGLTAMFQGRPGTGKTLVAGVIARELGLDLYQVDLSKVMSKWIGETERNLATIFDAAEDGQAVLLFDEADSLFAKRTEVRSSNDRYANLEVNYLLQRIDSFEGIAILTTNHGTSIDQALKRRLSFRLSFPFPDEETREQLWRAHLPPELPTSGPLTFDTLARKYHLSGGYIRNACLRAAFLAAQEDSPLHQHHLERAVALEFAELGKLSNTGAVD